MKFLNDFESIRENTALTIGMFDGLHIGHRSLLDSVRKNAFNGKTLIFTFKVPEGRPVLYTDREKRLVLSHTSVDFAYLQDYTQEFRNTTKEDFLKILCDKYNVKHLVVGTDFKFGKNGSGDVQYLLNHAREYGIDINVKEYVLFEGEKISSTRIRKSVRNGNVESAAKMLGAPYFILLEDFKFLYDGNGYKIISICNETKKILPPDGTYLTSFAAAPDKNHYITEIKRLAKNLNEGTVIIKTSIDTLKGISCKRPFCLYFLNTICLFENADTACGKTK